MPRDTWPSLDTLQGYRSVPFMTPRFKPLTYHTYFSSRLTQMFGLQQIVVQYMGPVPTPFFLFLPYHRLTSFRGPQRLLPIHLRDSKTHSGQFLRNGNSILLEIPQIPVVVDSDLPANLDQEQYMSIEVNKHPPKKMVLQKIAGQLGPSTFFQGWLDMVEGNMQPRNHKKMWIQHPCCLRWVKECQINIHWTVMETRLYVGNNDPATWEMSR